MERLNFQKKAAKYLGDPEGGLYNTNTFTGHSLKCTFVRGTPMLSDLNSKDLIARGSDFSFREDYQILPVIEWNTNAIQEIGLGMMGLGSFDVTAMFSLRLNDQLPSARTIPFETEFTIYEERGQEQVDAGLIMNALYGGFFALRGHSWTPNALIIERLTGNYRWRERGKELKMKNPSAIYPGPAEEVTLGDPRIGG